MKHYIKQTDFFIFLFCIILPFSNTIYANDIDSADASLVKETLGIDSDLSDLFPESDTADIKNNLEDNSKDKDKTPEITKDIEDIKESLKDNDTKANKFYLQDIELIGNKLYSEKELKKLYLKYIDTYITIDDLYYIRNIIKNHYQTTGYLLTEVLLIPQELNKYGATAKIKIVESYFSEVEYTDYKNSGIKYYIKNITDSIPANMQVLENNLLLINRLPGINAKGVIGPAEHTPGSSKLFIDAKEKKYGSYFAFNNHASLNVGPQQIRSGFHINNISWSNQLSFNLGFTPKNTDNMVFMGLEYKNYFYHFNGMELKLNYEYSKTKPHLSTLAAINLQGINTKYQAEVTYPYIVNRTTTSLLQLGINGYDNRSKNITGLAFQDKYRTLYIGNTTRTKDGYNGTSLLNTKLVYGFEAGRAAKNIATSRANLENKPITGSFAKATMDFNYHLNLSRKISLQTTINGQMTTGPVFSSEQISYGGQLFGLGYGQSGLIGDMGIMAKIEAKYNHYLNNQEVFNLSQAFVSFDAGHIRSHNGTPAIKTAQSFGLGLRLISIKGLEVNLTLAKPLVKDILERKDNTYSWYFSVQKTF